MRIRARRRHDFFILFLLWNVTDHIEYFQKCIAGRCGSKLVSGYGVLGYSSYFPKSGYAVFWPVLKYSSYFPIFPKIRLCGTHPVLISGTSLVLIPVLYSSLYSSLVLISGTHLWYSTPVLYSGTLLRYSTPVLYFGTLLGFERRKRKFLSTLQWYSDSVLRNSTVLISRTLLRYSSRVHVLYSNIVQHP